jgi:phosphate transport system substrate-binding protein
MKSKTDSIFTILCFTLLHFIFTACDDRNSGVKLDTPTSGHIHIAVDESFKPIFEAQIEAFQTTYKKASLSASYVSESEAIKMLVEDSARLAIATRPLTEDEAAVLKAQKLKPKSLKVAIDGVTLILNNSNQDTLFTMEQLKAIFSGRIKTWDKVSGKKFTKPITVVFDKSNSSNVEYIKRKFELSDSLESHVYAAGSNLDVIDYVKKNDNALGVIGVNWISDSDDPEHKTFRRVVRIAGIAAHPDAEADEYFQPYQAYLAQNQYPLSREIYIISREARAGLGTGFSAWVASDKGQRIFLKAGLLPATMPIRIVSINKKNKLFN